MKYKISELTVRQKFLALRRIDPSISIKDAGDGKWRVDVSSVNFSKTPPTEAMCSGSDTDEAINETWFWITMEDYEHKDKFFGGQRAIGPAEAQEIIRGWGESELWFRWQEFMWWPVVIQDSHGYRGPDLGLKVAEKPE